MHKSGIGPDLELFHQKNTAWKCLSMCIETTKKMFICSLLQPRRLQKLPRSLERLKFSLHNNRLAAKNVSLARWNQFHCSQQNVHTRIFSLNNKKLDQIDAKNTYRSTEGNSVGLVKWVQLRMKDTRGGHQGNTLVGVSEALQEPVWHCDAQLSPTSQGHWQKLVSNNHSSRETSTSRNFPRLEWLTKDHKLLHQGPQLRRRADQQNKHCLFRSNCVDRRKYWNASQHETESPI